MNRRAEAKAKTRSAAIEAARRLWARPGSYETNGIREIADAMRMSTGAVFANFNSKADLWRAAFDCDPPVDSPITRLGPKAVALLEKIAGVDSQDLVFTATGHDDLSLEINRLLGEVSMARELAVAA